MKKLILTAFVASSLVTGPGMLMTSTGAFAQGACDAGAPEAWFRPGGYCDSIGAGKSLVSPTDPSCTDFVYVPPVVIGTSAVQLRKNDRIQMAMTCTIECDYYPLLDLGSVEMQIRDRVRVAQGCPE